jgi:uncharacterized coiled-coil protein SlyX
MSEEVEQSDDDSTESLKEKIASLESEAAKQETRLNELWAKIVAAESSGQTLQQTMAKLEAESAELSKTNSEVQESFESFEESLTETTEKLETISKNFTEYFTRVDPNSKSKFENVVEHHAAIDKIIQEIEASRKEVVDFKNLFFGDGTAEAPGLKKRVEAFLKESERNYKALLQKKEENFKALFDKVEGLLPGATSTGLAKAFQEQKESYLRPVIIWSFTFVCTIVSMIAFALYEFKEVKESVTDITGSLIHIVSRLPFFAPAIWLAIFAAKRQNQSMRLLQEYSYKETLAKSYEGHKREIDKLPKSEEKNELLSKHLATMVEMCASNPSLTLEHKSHDERPPFLDWIKTGKKKVSEATGGEAAK